MNKLLTKAFAIKDEIIRNRRSIHRYPEIGFELTATSAFVKEKLADMGIKATDCGGPLSKELRAKFAAIGFKDMTQSTGVVATIGKGKPCILLRADMDALKMSEAEGLVEFSSLRPGCTHACGHDAHTAMLLGAARILKGMENELRGTVKLMFQTGEECGCGSKLMIESGVLEDPAVDAAFAIHVMPQEKTGSVSYSPGIASAAYDVFRITVIGKGGHSSQPQCTVDPLMIANQLYTTLNLLPSREIDPRETVALTIGLVEGGTTANIIPSSAGLMLGVRTFNRDVRAHLATRIPEIIDHVVKMWRGTYELIDFHTPSTFTDQALIEETLPYIREIVGDNIKTVPCTTATEDFSYISEQVPSMFAWLGAGAPDQEPLHSPHMIIDEDCLPVGSAILANVACNWLRTH